MKQRSYLAAVLLAAMSGVVIAQFPPTPKILENISSSLEDAVREAGQESNRPSMALIDRETARSMNYDNQLKHVRTYFEKRKLNRSYREAERLPRRTSAQITAAAKRKSPDRLTVQQFDSLSGRINWPIVLRSDDYSNLRKQLDQLYAAHCRDGGGINTAYYAAIQSTATEMETQLKSNRESTNSDQYVYARRFLASLKYEARFSVGT